MSETQSPYIQSAEHKAQQSQAKHPENPLKQYYRNYETYVKLPSTPLNAYSMDVLTYTSKDNEIGVRPMTGADELILKNPEALINGEAIKTIIESCCPDIHDPERLFQNDIETLMIAIRLVSFGKMMEIHATCPNEECYKSKEENLDENGQYIDVNPYENLFELNLETLISSIDLLTGEYTVDVSQHDDQFVRVYVRPYQYKDVVKLQKQSFEEERMIDQLNQQEGIDDVAKLQKVASTFLRIAQTSSELMSSSVYKAEIYHGDQMIQDVYDPEHLKDFVRNLSRQDVNNIRKKLDELHSIGVNNEFSAQCNQCGHQWTQEVSFDPANFFSDT